MKKAQRRRQEAKPAPGAWRHRIDNGVWAVLERGALWMCRECGIELPPIDAREESYRT